jgi:hypothetical protein
MPAEIVEMMEETFMGTGGTNYDRTIRQRLAKIRELLDVHRWQPDVASLEKAEEEAKGGVPERHGFPQPKDGEPGGKGGLAKAIYRLLRSEDGEPAKKKNTHSRYPKVTWLSAHHTPPTRALGDLEGRAARYVPGPNLILANADFVGFEQVADLITNELRAPRGLIKEIARLEYETVLTETVMSMLSLEGGKDWSKEEVKAALNEEALTTAVMSRFHIYQSVRKDAMRKAKQAQRQTVV